MWLLEMVFFGTQKTVTVHFPCCISCYLLYTFSCPLGIFFINLTTIIQMVMSKVVTRILFNHYILYQPLFRRVCFVSLITIKMQILHSQSENFNFRNTDCITQFLSIFSILSRFSFLYWLSCSFIDIHCFFRSVTNLHSYSGSSSPIPPPQTSRTGSPLGPWWWVMFLDVGDVWHP